MMRRPLIWALVLLLAACAPALPSSTGQPVSVARRSPAVPTPGPSAVASPSPTAGVVLQPGEHLVGHREAYTQGPGIHPLQMLVDGINEGTTEVDASYYALNHPLIVQAFIDAEGRCRCVRLITDATQAGGKEQKAALLKIQAAGVPIKADAHAGIMHLKELILNFIRKYSGSFNATVPASTVNDEELDQVDSPEDAQVSLARFNAMWNDTTRFKDWNPAGNVRAPAPDDF